MKRLLKIITVIIIFNCQFSIVNLASAQCETPITAFSGSETINYKLYFNWKFIWIGAGTASLNTVPTEYKGKKGYKTSLVTQTSKKIDRYFMMRDTIMSIFSDKLVPLYYRKGAREGKRYYVDEMWYSYPDANTCQTTTRHIHDDGHKTAEKHVYRQCMTDMLHAFQQFRNMDTSDWKKGQSKTISIAGGSEVIKARLYYRDDKTIKGEDGNKYKCKVISYIEKDGKKDKEIVRFYVTEDSRHIPIRLDLFLKFGSAKAFFVGMK
ncbi:MAG: DUF3108 domain-containing protein [Prevotella sp.]|nr:DUF3108 domain-containing protein [Prevotella sp.]